MKQTWLVQTRRQNPVKPVKHVFLKMDTKSFKHALDCVRALVHFNMMGQYRSHTPETIAYMEEYLDGFHRMKDIFLEVRVCKQTRAKVDKQRKELRHQRA